MSAIAAGRVERAAASGDRLIRWSPIAGVASALFFIGGVAASSPPSDGASNAKWIADYTSSHAGGHIASGALLAVSGVTFLLFVAGLWQRIVANESAAWRPSPLPLIAAAVTAACMGIGGVLMAVPGVIVNAGAPIPSADVLRLCNDAGFASVAVPGMLAAAVAVATLSLQGRRVALLGRRLQIFGFVVSVGLLASIEFLPIVLLVVWMVTVAVVQLRRPMGAALTSI